MKKLLSLLCVCSMMLVGCSGGGSDSSKIDSIIEGAADEKEEFLKLSDYMDQNLNSYKEEAETKDTSGNLVSFYSNTAWKEDGAYLGLSVWGNDSSYSETLTSTEFVVALACQKDSGNATVYEYPDEMKTQILESQKANAQHVINANILNGLTKVEKIDSSTYKVYYEIKTDVYKTNDDGSVVNDDNGQPIVERQDIHYAVCEFTFNGDGFFSSIKSYSTDENYEMFDGGTTTTETISDWNSVNVDAQKMYDDLKAKEGKSFEELNSKF